MRNAEIRFQTLCNTRILHVRNAEKLSCYALIVKKLLNVIGVAVLNLFGQKTICEMDNKYIFKYKAA